MGIYFCMAHICKEKERNKRQRETDRQVGMQADWQANRHIQSFCSELPSVNLPTRGRFLYTCSEGYKESPVSKYEWALPLQCCPSTCVLGLCWTEYARNFFSKEFETWIQFHFLMSKSASIWSIESLTLYFLFLFHT